MLEIDKLEKVIQEEITKFLANLEETKDKYNWKLNLTGSIRGKTKIDNEEKEFCPMSAVYYEKQKEYKTIEQIMQGWLYRIGISSFTSHIIATSADGLFDRLEFSEDLLFKMCQRLNLSGRILLIKYT